MSIDKLCLCYLIHKKCLEVSLLRNRIKDLREDRDLTQQKLADIIGITQRKYSYIETGVQPLTDEILIKLADFYNVSIDYLLMQTNDPKRNK